MNVKEVLKKLTIDEIALRIGCDIKELVNEILNTNTCYDVVVKEAYIDKVIGRREEC